MVGLMERTARLDRAVAQKLGERFQLCPVLKSHFENGLDVDRPGAVFLGHLFLNKEQADLGGRGGEWDSRVSISGAILKVAFNELPLGVNVQEGDEIIALERKNQKSEDQKFKVSLVSRKTGIFWFELGDMG